MEVHPQTLDGPYLDVAELGEANCHQLSEELGSPPPWPLAVVKAHFDCQYEGWDTTPPDLSVSSPLSRLRSFGEELGVRGEALDDALRELTREVKYTQIRTLTPPQKGEDWQYECQLTLILMNKLVALLLAERLGRKREGQETAEDLAAARELSRCAEATAQERDALRGQVEELHHEAETQRQRADLLKQRMEAELEKMRQQLTAEHDFELRQREQAVTHWRKEHDAMQEQVQDAKAQKKHLAVANEELHGELRELERRARQGFAADPDSLRNTSVQTDALSGATDGAVVRAFASGAQKALALQERSSEMLRSCLMAWRVARLQARCERLGSAAAASSLTADLATVGSCSSCNKYHCRLEQQQERLKRSEAEALAVKAHLAGCRSRFCRGLAVALAAFLLYCWWVEPYLDLAPSC